MTGSTYTSWCRISVLSLPDLFCNPWTMFIPVSFASGPSYVSLQFSTTPVPNQIITLPSIYTHSFPLVGSFFKPAFSCLCPFLGEGLNMRRSGCYDFQVTIAKETEHVCKRLLLFFFLCSSSQSIVSYRKDKGRELQLRACLHKSK